jgi:hypothetical protein
MVRIIFEFECFKIGTGVGLGLAPALGYVVMSYGHRFKPLRAHISNFTPRSYIYTMGSPVSAMTVAFWF